MAELHAQRDDLPPIRPTHIPRISPGGSHPVFTRDARTGYGNVLPVPSNPPAP